MEDLLSTGPTPSSFLTGQFFNEVSFAHLVLDTAGDSGEGGELVGRHLAVQDTVLQ